MKNLSSFNEQLKMIFDRYMFVMKSGILFACTDYDTSILYLSSVLKYMKKVHILEQNLDFYK